MTLYDPSGKKVLTATEPAVAPADGGRPSPVRFEATLPAVRPLERRNT